MYTIDFSRVMMMTMINDARLTSPLRSINQSINQSITQSINHSLTTGTTSYCPVHPASPSKGYSRQHPPHRPLHAHHTAYYNTGTHGSQIILGVFVRTTQLLSNKHPPIDT
jgi:hypothetical protein